MKKIGIICISVFFSCSLVAQNRVADSLLNILNTQKLPPSEELKLYLGITQSFSAYDMPNTYLYGMEGLKLAEKEKDKEMLLAFTGFVGSTYIYRAIYDTALVYVNRQVQIARELNNPEYIRSVYLILGNIYARQGKFVPALENYTKVLEMWDGMGNPRSYILALGNIGECHRRLNNLDRAIYYLEQQRKLSEEINETTGIFQSYRELGSVYLAKGDTDKALEYVLKIANHPGGLPPVHEADCKEILVRIYVIKKEYDKALKAANDCLVAAKILGDPYIDVLTWNAFSDIYREQKRYKECEEAAMKAWNIDSTSIDTAPITSYNIAYANIFLGNDEKAARFFQKSNEMNRLKNERGFHDALSDMEVKYESEKKEIQIVSLKKSKELYGWLFVAGSAIFLLISGLLLFRHRLNIHKRKLAEQQISQLEQEQQLVATQALLDGETAERLRLARDLHDGLGGMLSVVKLNLADMKSYPIMDGQDSGRFSKAMEMLDNSIGELRRVAHHMMPDSLMRYGLKVSIEDFCLAIPNAHFLYFGEDTRLDSRLEILIYRCAYELVNNAVKHAQASKINVQLLIDNHLISLTIFDNGIGFDPESVGHGAGFMNIRNRVSTYNGKIQVHSSPGKGTEISIEIELE